jgi:hypothetical protein
MMTHKPVSVSKNAFIFCRYSLALLLWLSLIFRFKWLVLLTGLIFLLSYFLRIKNAPMITLYKITLSKFLKSDDEILDESAMRFAHGIGAALSLFTFGLLISPVENAGWFFLVGFATLKTISALGFCPAAKLYSCLTSGSTCCRFAGRNKC